MALTEQERAELAGLIKSEYNQEVDLSQLNDAEIGDLVTELGAAAAPTQEPSQPVDLGRQVRAATASGINALTLGNLSKMLPEEANQKLAELRSQEPAASNVGNAMGLASTFMYPAGAISKIPAVAKAIEGSTKLKLLADVAGGATTGAGYGFLTNPQVAGSELDARIENAKTGGMIGAGFGTIPTILTKGGEAYFKSPFKKIDAALVKAGKKPISDILWKRKITGSLSGIEGELQNVLDTELYPEIEKVKQGLKDKGYQYDINDVRDLVLKNLPNESKDVGIANEITGLKNYATDAFDKYTPEGWMKTLRSYVNKRKGYEKEKAAFEIAGGAGDQLPILGAIDPGQSMRPQVTSLPTAQMVTRPPSGKATVLRVTPKKGQLAINTNMPEEQITKEIKVPLQTEGSKASAEPFEPFGVQPELPTLPTKEGDIFNTPRGDDLLPLAQNMKLDQMTNDAMVGTPNYQAEILGLQRIPQKYGVGSRRVRVAKKGQTKIPFSLENVTSKEEIPVQLQGDITPRLFEGILPRIEQSSTGQGAFPIAPQKPQVPSKKMTVDDYDLLMKRIGQKGKAGFVQTAPGQQTPIPADLMADFYGALKGQREAAVAEQLGPEVAAKYKAVNQETSTILNSFKKLSDAAQNEAATNTITPIEGMFLLNPATAKYAMTKEGIELLRSPYFATKIGKAMNKVGNSSLAPTNPVPFFLRKNENAQEQ